MLVKELRNGSVSRKDGSIKYVPYNYEDFDKELQLAVSYADGKKFLDVGCGIGDKLLIAREMFGLDVIGIEIDKEYIKLAHKILDNVIIQEDVLNYSGYGLYDIVYMYKPFADKEKQTKLERLIESQMREGAILIAPVRIAESKLKQLDNNIWVK